MNSKSIKRRSFLTSVASASFISNVAQANPSLDLTQSTRDCMSHSLQEIPFNQVIDRQNLKPNDSMKWNKYSGKDILPMWVADMDFATPLCIREALINRIAHPVLGYQIATREVQEALVLHFSRDFNYEIKPEWIVWMPGVDPGLNASVRMPENSNAAALTTVPIYPPFTAAPLNFQRQLQTTTLVQRPDGAWEYDWDALEKTINENTKVFMLCNPHNPTGRVWRKEELLKIGELANKHDWIICSDDIHSEFIYDNQNTYIPICSLDESIAKRTILLGSPSKIYNMPGLGAAFAVISNETLRERFKKIIKGIVPSNINLLALAATTAAYREGKPWRDKLIPYLRNNRDLLTEAINRMPGLSMSKPDATYLAWINASGMQLPKNQTAAQFFEKAGVGLSPGEVYIPGGTNYVRLNFGCPLSTLNKALDRMQKACSNR